MAPFDISFTYTSSLCFTLIHIQACCEGQMWALWREAAYCMHCVCRTLVTVVSNLITKVVEFEVTPDNETETETEDDAGEEEFAIDVSYCYVTTMCY